MKNVSTIGQDEPREPVAVDPEDLVEEYFPGLLMNTTNTRSAATVSEVIYIVNKGRSINKLSSHLYVLGRWKQCPFG